MATKKRKVSKKTYQDAKAYYTHGGAAYDIEPIEEEYAPPKKQVKKQKKIKKKPSPTMQVRANRVYSIKVALVLGIFFCGTLAFMWTSALATSQRVETQKYKDKLADLKSENALLAIDVSEQMDLDTVKKIATEKLGMVEPQPYQIQYIDVPEQSYTLHYNDETEQPKEQNEENTLVRTIVGLFKKE